MATEIAQIPKNTYRQKKVITRAPDAIIHINNSPTIEVCPICQAKMNLSEYLTSITTSLSNNTTVGTANIVITIPRHGHNTNYLVRGGKVYGLRLMDEVEIYFKGYFKNDAGDYYYYKSFWGIITEIAESYNDGLQTITINCQSMLKWMQLMQTNVHPAAVAFQYVMSSGSAGAALYSSKVYAGMNPWEIIYLLVNISFLNIVHPTVFNQEGPETPSNPFTYKDIDLMNAWMDKFQRIKSALRMFGTTPESFISIDKPDFQEGKKKALEQVQVKGLEAAASNIPNIATKILYDSSLLKDFKPFFKMEEQQQLDVLQSSYQSNLEIISMVKAYTGFEFYLDTTGELVFKPPFWNLDVRDNPIFVIKDEEILSWDIIESEAEIVTRVEVMGRVNQQFPGVGTASTRGVYTDYNLARRFGLRCNQINGSLCNTKESCYYYAISEMERVNAGRFTGSLAIIGRPELKLGFPVYIESKDSFVYVENIQHNFSFGGTFTTQVQFSSMRRKYVGPDNKGIRTPDDVKDVAPFSINGESTMLVLQGYTDDDAARQKQLENTMKIAAQTSDAIVQQDETESNTQVANKPAFDDKLAHADPAFNAVQNTLVKTNRYGTYIEKDLSDPLVQEILKKMEEAKTKDSTTEYMSILDYAIPVSDENGYELIGVFENGRTYKLLRDGNLLKKGALNILGQQIDRTKSANRVTTSDKTDTSQKSADAKVLKDPIVGGYTYSKHQAQTLTELTPTGQKTATQCICNTLVQFGTILQPETTRQALIQDARRKLGGT